MSARSSFISIALEIMPWLVLNVRQSQQPEKNAERAGRITGLRTAATIHSTSWHEMHREATDLAARVAPLGPFRGIVAIARGGLVPASIVARVLNIRLIETLCIASYDGKQKGPLVVVKPAPEEAGDGSGWLLVDDVADSGSTAETARRMLPAAHYATLYVKPEGHPFVDSFVREVAQHVWIDFPWDRDPARTD